MTIQIYKYDDGSDELGYFVIDEGNQKLTFMKPDLYTAINNVFWNTSVACELKEWFGRVDINTYKVFYEDTYPSKYIQLMYEGQDFEEIKTWYSTIEELLK